MFIKNSPDSCLAFSHSSSSHGKYIRSSLECLVSLDRRIRLSSSFFCSTGGGSETWLACGDGNCSGTPVRASFRVCRVVADGGLAAEDAFLFVPCFGAAASFFGFEF